MPNLCISRTLTFLQPSFYWLLLLLEIVAARSPHRADLVHGDAGVEMYLRRYGWLAPVAWEKMPTEPAITSTFDLERLALPEILEGGETSRTFKWKHRHLQTTVSTKTTEQPKIREDLLPALQRFQQANSIPVTGRLDSETLSFLNSPRCGVPDHLLGLTAREEDEKEDGNIAVVDDEALDGIGNGDDGELVGDGDDHRAEAKVKIKNKIQDDVITSSDELVLSNPEFSRDAAFNKTSETQQPNMANTIFHKTLSPQSNITDIVDVEEGRNQTDEPMMRQNYTWGQPVQNYSKDDSSSMQKANYSEENIQWENDKTTYPPTMDNPTTQSQSFTDSIQTKQTREDLHHSTDGKSRRDVNSQKQSNIGRIRLKRKLQWLQEKPVRTRRTLQKTNEEEEINTNVMQAAERKRTKRALLGHRSGGQVVFGRRPLRWRLIGEGYSSQLSIGEQRQVLKLAFRMWSEVAPVEFQEDLVSPPAFVDIKLGFGTGRHLGCVRTFDGFGHEFAHAWRLGDVHFDDDENFSLPNSPRGINLLKVAVHEIGHVLGLQHVMTRNSVMQPRYLPHNGAFELDAVDRKHVQHMYGICNSPFDTIFDWVRSERQPDGRPVIFFNTYIFRNSWYWMYENRKGRPRHGDPLPISAGWPGLPISQIDGFAHVWMGSQDCTYFFKGAYYWRYDNSRDQVYSVDPEGVTYPRLIPEEFPGVPYPIDTVYFDHEDRHLYFFKENNVTAFDIYKRRPVFGHPIPLVSLFLPVRPGDHPFGGLDAAYYSYSLGSLFLLKNSQVWQVVPSRQHPAGTVTPHRDLLPGRSVSDTWKDVCDVHISMLNMA